MDSNAHIGMRIREERERLGWSQQAAANAVGVRREMWAKYEAGSEPGAKALAGMITAGVDVVYVLTGQRPVDASAPTTSSLTQQEKTLLTNYRNTPASRQHFIQEAAFMASERVTAKTGSK